MAQAPDQQHAWVNLRRGKPSEALEYRTDWPVPKELGPGEVLIKVHAAALNPAGHKLMKWMPNFVANRPRVAEYDFSGTVLDANGTRFKDGDNVFGWVRSDRMNITNQGSLCQYTKVSEDWIVHCPKNVPLDKAAGFAIAGLTAHHFVVKHANLQNGQRIFINGGSTSVGAFAIQIAKSRGAHVTASASAKNEAFVRGLGADEFVDYTSVSLPEFLRKRAVEERKFDYILEAAGINDPSLYTESDLYLSPMGCYTTVGPQPSSLTPSELWKIAKTLFFQFLPVALGGVKAPFRLILFDYRREDLEQLQQYIAEGSVKPVVDSVFEFKNALKAYDHLMNDRVTGKVLVTVS